MLSNFLEKTNKLAFFVFLLINCIFHFFIKMRQWRGYTYKTHMFGGPMFAGQNIQHTIQGSFNEHYKNYKFCPGGVIRYAKVPTSSKVCCLVYATTSSISLNINHLWNLNHFKGLISPYLCSSSSSLHWSFSCFYVVFVPLEYIPSILPRSTYVIVYFVLL